jgi:hypothetical protein
MPQVGAGVRAVAMAPRPLAGSQGGTGRVQRPARSGVPIEGCDEMLLRGGDIARQQRPAAGHDSKRPRRTGPAGPGVQFVGGLPGQVGPAGSVMSLGARFMASWDREASPYMLDVAIDIPADFKGEVAR